MRWLALVLGFTGLFGLLKCSSGIHCYYWLAFIPGFTMLMACSFEWLHLGIRLAFRYGFTGAMGLLPSLGFTRLRGLLEYLALFLRLAYSFNWLYYSVWLACSPWLYAGFRLAFSYGFTLPYGSAS